MYVVFHVHVYVCVCVYVCICMFTSTSGFYLFDHALVFLVRFSRSEVFSPNHLGGNFNRFECFEVPALELLGVIRLVMVIGLLRLSLV